MVCAKSVLLIPISAPSHPKPLLSAFSGGNMSEQGGRLPVRARRPADAPSGPLRYLCVDRCRFPIEVADSHEKWRVGGGFPPEVAKMFGADCCF